jgi:HD-GYP domain-containing protein (c-di-GMP phosphodiesterase class II)
MSVGEVDFDEGVLMPIAVVTLRAASILPFDLYLPSESQNRLVLYRERKLPIEESDLLHLKQRGVRTLFIAQGESSSYRAYVRDTLLNNENLPAIERYQVICEAARCVLTEAFAQGDTDAAVQITRDLSEGLVQTVCESEFVLHELLGIMSHDYSVFTHAVNVTTSCLLLARQLGYSERKELLQIGQGALLKDIGVLGVPRHILEKPDKLSERERRIMQEHPIRGFKELCRREEMSWGLLMMVYSHHERCDGRGYPVGLLKAETHPYARLCAICDVYEALRHERPYRRAARRGDALEYLDRQAGRAFDEEIMRCWMSVIAKKK